MKTFTISALIFGVALCAPVGVYASDGAAPMQKHHAHHRVAYLQLPLSATALAPTPVLVPAAPAQETDGLSRNPDDCMRWGCIDHR